MSKNKSFTLIELLVVIVIIGILAGVIVISTSSSIDKANFAKAQAFSNTVQNELLLNLVSEWTFDEPQVGNITKDSWGTNHGTVVGAIQVDDCVYGKCYSFDGVDDYIIANLIFTENNFTLSLWGKIIEYNSGSFAFISDPFSFGIWIQEGLVNFGIWGATVSQKNIYQYNSDKNWHQYVLTYNYLSGYATAYIDGKTTTPYLINDNIRNTTKIYFGGKSPNSWYFNGLIDDIRIYNAALSSSQIKQNYIAGLNSMLSNGNISKQEYNERIESLGSR